MRGLSRGFGRWFVWPRGAWRLACQRCNGVSGGGFFGVLIVRPGREARRA